MIRNCSLEEISNGKRLALNDMVRVECNECDGCSHCCYNMGDTIVLDPLDICRLTACQNTSFEQLIGRNIELHVVEGVILPNLIMSQEKNCCTFLGKDERCMIHSYRPGICRLFPLGRIYEGGTFHYFLQDGECVKPNKTKIKVSEWIDTPQLEKNQKYILQWHDFIHNLQQSIKKAQNNDEVKDINLGILNLFYSTPYRGEDWFYVDFEQRLKQAKQLFYSTLSE